MKVGTSRKVLSHRLFLILSGNGPYPRDAGEAELFTWLEAALQAPVPQKLMGLKFPDCFTVSCITVRKIPAQDVIPGVKERTGSVVCAFTDKCKRREIK